MTSNNTIDLNRAEQAVSLLTNDKRRGYQSTTLKQYNNVRCIYLPLFPTNSFGPNDCLLLANVPITRLASHEIARRQHGAYTSDALMLMNNYQCTSNDTFTLSEQDTEELTARLRVGKSIITFNAERLRGICYYLLALYASFRRNVLLRNDVALKDPTLNSKQMAIVLEFYLQIDVDIFYMKTCSFRGAESYRSFNTEGDGDGLFCDKDEPQARYTMLACGNLFCQCCHPLNHSKKSQSWPVVDFVSSSMHQFVNGYTTYLNCPATCNTRNVIYTMTCPCGHYDYVDSTADTLADALAYHRYHGNRIIHEKLTGNSLYPNVTFQPNERENEIAKKMRLYQHAARCPVALRSFLDHNADYWCFVPFFWQEAQTENMAFFRRMTNVSDFERTNVLKLTALGNHKAANCLSYVPLTPATYTFSYRQREKQRLFFENLLSSPVDELPYSPVDLYKVTIIAVLPDDQSSILRYIIETLFIIHGEPKLNMICPLGGDVEKRYGRPYELVWCADLNHPSTV